MERSHKFNEKFAAAKKFEAQENINEIKKGKSHVVNAIKLLKLATTQCESNLIEEAQEAFEESIVEILQAANSEEQTEERRTFLRVINEKSISELQQKISNESDHEFESYLSTLIEEDCYAFLRAIEKDRTQNHRIKSEKLQSLLKEKLNPEP